MKPPGLEMKLHGDAVVMGITRSTPVEDAVWCAVEEAVAAGWTVKQFTREAWQAWEHELEKRVKDANDDWRKVVK